MDKRRETNANGKCVVLYEFGESTEDEDPERVRNNDTTTGEES